MNYILEETREALDRLRKSKEQELEEYKSKSYAKKKEIIKEEGVILGIVEARLMLKGVDRKFSIEDARKLKK